MLHQPNAKQALALRQPITEHEITSLMLGSQKWLFTVGKVAQQ
jgi:hypothetical protein